MIERDFKIAVEALLNRKINQAIMFTPTGGKEGVIAHHIQWVRSRSGGGWDDDIAQQRFATLKSEMGL